MATMGSAATPEQGPRRGRGTGWIGWVVAGLLILVALILGAAVLIGAVRVNVGSTAANTVPTPGPVLTDDQIRQEIQASLQRDARIPNGGGITVDVKNGLVTLSGAVQTFQQKQAASEIVRNTPGAGLLNNQLLVQPGTPVSDQEIEQMVKTGLKVNGTTQASEFMVSVKNGVVALGGTVDSLEAKVEAERVASSVAGVRDVQDAIVVNPKVQRSDSQITNDVQQSIQHDPRLRDQEIHVQTQNGMVTLTGRVTTLAYRELAGTYATYAPGARGLDNQIKVQP